MTSGWKVPSNWSSVVLLMVASLSGSYTIRNGIKLNEWIFAMSLYLCGCSISPQLDECTEGKLLLDDVLMQSPVEAAYCPSRMVQWITDNNTTLGFWWHCSIFIVVDHNWMQCTLLVDVVAALYTILGLEAVVFCKVHDDEQTTWRQTLGILSRFWRLLFLVSSSS